jgi:hypothetical protein
MSRAATLAIVLGAAVAAGAAERWLPRLQEPEDHAGSEDLERELERARRARPGLRAAASELGVHLRSAYVFLGADGTEQPVRALLFLTPDGQLSQTLSSPRGGSKQVLGRAAGWAERTTYDAAGRALREGGELAPDGLLLVRARALAYELLLRFPWSARELRCARDPGSDSPEALAWTCESAGVQAFLRTDRATALLHSIEIPAAGLSVACGTWGPVPPGSRPPGAEMPLHWRWSQGGRAPGPEVREELLEFQCDVVCPPDLLAALRSEAPGARVDLDPRRAERAVERWPLRIEEPLAPAESFAADASGFADLLRLLGSTAAARLDPGALRPPVLAWQPSVGRFAVLRSCAPREAYLSAGAEGLVLEIADPLSLASQVGPEFLGAPVAQILWSAAEEAGPDGTRYSSLRLGILR